MLLGRAEQAVPLNGYLQGGPVGLGISPFRVVGGTIGVEVAFGYVLFAAYGKQHATQKGTAFKPLGIHVLQARKYVLLIWRFP